MTAPPLDLTAQHRAEVELVLAWALEDLRKGWPDDPDPRAVQAALDGLLPELAGTYGSAAATLGADWYEDMREVAGAPGRYRATPAPLPDAGRYAALAGYAVGPLFGAEPDAEMALARTEGGLQRIVADADRNTVRVSLAKDPQATGWMRQTTGKSCAFCVMIAGRGTVYSARTADFASHDRCDCICVPAWGGDPRKVQPYVPSQRFRSDEARAANNARVREDLRDN